MEIDLKIDVEQAANNLLNYQRKKLPTAVTRTLNKTIRGVLTDTKRLMAKRIGMTQKEIADRTKLTFSTSTNLVASMEIRGERRVPNMSAFRARQMKKGVSARVWERRRVYKGTFIVQRRGGKKDTVFKRVHGAKKVRPTKGRYAGKVIKRGPRKGQPVLRQPIAPVFGTSLRRAFVAFPRDYRPAKEVLYPMAIGRFEKEFSRQINRITK